MSKDSLVRGTKDDGWLNCAQNADQLMNTGELWQIKGYRVRPGNAKQAPSHASSLSVE